MPRWQPRTARFLGELLRFIRTAAGDESIHINEKSYLESKRPTI
jgi:hypothetical protein